MLFPSTFPVSCDIGVCTLSTKNVYQFLLFSCWAVKEGVVPRLESLKTRGFAKGNEERNATDNIPI